jgi:hypothetical protein
MICYLDFDCLALIFFPSLCGICVFSSPWDAIVSPCLGLSGLEKIILDTVFNHFPFDFVAQCGFVEAQRTIVTRATAAATRGRTRARRPD